MTQEDKELLLKDLCARLPYGVKVLDNSHKNYGVSKLINIGIDGSMLINNEINDIQYYPIIDEIKPYLRPMSSMTIVERKRFLMLKGAQRGYITENGYHEDKEMYPVEGNCAICCHLDSYSRNIDWLNANHFDYHGLIPKGLALEALPGMYS